jgi:hypothetical protein
LINKYNFNVGVDFYRDDDGTLCSGTKTYITRMLRNDETLFGSKAKEFSVLMEMDDHPELDLTFDDLAWMLSGTINHSLEHCSGRSLCVASKFIVRS